MSYIVLYACGAYGRKANLKDWHAGKDFKILDGSYFSIRDIERLKKDGYKEIRFYIPSSIPIGFRVEL